MLKPRLNALILTFHPMSLRTAETTEADASFAISQHTPSIRTQRERFERGLRVVLA